MAKSILSQESPHLRRRLLPSGRITRIMTFTMMASELLNHKKRYIVYRLCQSDLFFLSKLNNVYCLTRC